MTFNPTLGDTRESYDMAVALGYDWVRRAHDGERVDMSEIILEREPFTVTDDGGHVLVREISVRPDGTARYNRRGDHVIRRVKLLPTP